MERELKKTVIKPGRQSVGTLLFEFWASRELLWSLAWRQVILRYKQTALGILWTIIQPLIAMVIFAIVFGRYAKLPNDGIPYPLFAYSALVFWGLFSEGVTRASDSLVGNEKLITKVYFSRIVIPFSATLSALVDFVISFILVVLMAAYYGYYPSIYLGYALLAIVIALGSAIGMGMFFSALNVRYRDFKYALPFLFQIWLYASPVVYSTTLIPSAHRLYFHLNPAAGMIELARFSITGQGHVSVPGVILSFCAMLCFILVGFLVFRVMERTFADYV